MIEESLVYEGRSSGWGRHSTRAYSQELFWQSAYFSEFFWQEFCEEVAIDIKSNALLISNDISSSQSATNESTINNYHEITQHKTEIATVAIDLLVLTEAENLIKTVSTDIEIELPIESNLNREQLTKSDLVASLG